MQNKPYNILIPVYIKNKWAKDGGNSFNCIHLGTLCSTLPVPIDASRFACITFLQAAKLARLSSLKNQRGNGKWDQSCRGILKPAQTIYDTDGYGAKDYRVQFTARIFFSRNIGKNQYSHTGGQVGWLISSSKIVLPCNLTGCGSTGDH